MGSSAQSRWQRQQSSRTKQAARHARLGPVEAEGGGGGGAFAARRRCVFQYARSELLKLSRSFEALAGDGGGWLLSTTTPPRQYQDKFKTMLGR